MIPTTVLLSETSSVKRNLTANMKKLLEAGVSLSLVVAFLKVPVS